MIDPKARGVVCADKRARVTGAKDQRTISGRADSIPRAVGDRSYAAKCLMPCRARY
jgi:hypothetical protein